MGFKFIHASDIHLDSPLRGLERYDGAPVELIRGATRKAFLNLIELCLKEKTDFLLMAGDLYDGDWKDYNTGLFFISQVSRLREAGIEVFVVRGNHDAASRITRKMRLPENVTDFSSNRPETVLLESLGVAIHGYGYPSADVRDNLSLSYPDPITGYFNIGLLHTAAEGREGHASYAPCSVKELIAKGYDYWALGHVHKREIINQEPWIVFPGNIQGRNIREVGNKGCTVVQVEDKVVQSVEHCDLDVLRWCLCLVDATGAVSVENILDIARQELEKELSDYKGKFLAVRFVIQGACPVHENLLKNPGYLTENLRALASDYGFGEVWVEKIKIQTRMMGDLEKVASQYHPISSLLQFIRGLSTDRETLEGLLSELESLKNILPPEFYDYENLNLGDEQLVLQLIPDVEEMILTRLLSKEEFTDEV
ncbi:MAG: DNA repair exonuclease [Candidatus Contubernalis sp.]|nr:DNA repair exonuclease [Candidatus Contubernalis sp.]